MPTPQQSDAPAFYSTMAAMKASMRLPTPGARRIVENGVPLDLRRKRKNVGQKESDALVHRSADRALFFRQLVTRLTNFGYRLA
jgi:hypothetical protein